VTVTFNDGEVKTYEISAGAGITSYLMREAGESGILTLRDDDAQSADFLNSVIKENKHKDFLHSPILTCTIDQIILATEVIRGGKYILPCLRLLSSDLVIDEIDDFSGSDLVAIGRLIHLAAMLGRKVMISSATIPPSLAEGFFNTYQEGWKINCAFKKENVAKINCAIIDEFSSDIESIIINENCQESYQNFHQKFIAKRVLKLE
jgi:CRISPR-associated endonuclease/helicase Cas3